MPKTDAAFFIDEYSEMTSPLTVSCAIFFPRALPTRAL